MAEIKLERTIWPVGHGAFYTEQFKNEHGDVLFTAVYDCGSEQHKMRAEKLKDLLFQFHNYQGMFSTIVEMRFNTNF